MHTPGVTHGRKERAVGKTICVTGISDGEKKTTLQGAFGDFGDITRIEIPPGRSVAFVEFTEKRDAQEAADVMDRKTINGCIVTVRLADERPPGAGAQQGTTREQRDVRRLHEDGLLDGAQDKHLQYLDRSGGRDRRGGEYRSERDDWRDIRDRDHGRDRRDGDHDSGRGRDARDARSRQGDSRGRVANDRRSRGAGEVRRRSRS
mmetsp:Transcript_64619/g.179731  ORF Transcript_64619/g.179731 Transcript_64619/m.179731 type:complete len:205 (-) Transcript_64619:243-857(-)